MFEVTRLRGAAGNWAGQLRTCETPVMPRPLMVRSVERLIPDDETVKEVVPLQYRPAWIMVAGAAVAATAASFMIGQLGWNTIFGSTIAGTLAGGTVGLLTTPYLLAGTSSRTLLFKSSKMRARADELVKEIPDGTTLRRTGTFANDVYDLMGQRLIGSRALRDRLAAIMPVEPS